MTQKQTASSSHDTDCQLNLGESYGLLLTTLVKSTSISGDQVYLNFFSLGPKFEILCFPGTQAQENI
jgi:hypothetical protein